MGKYHTDGENTANKTTQSSAKFKVLERRLRWIDNKHINVAKNPHSHTLAKYNTIFVSNLGDQVSQTDLVELFGAIGPLKKCMQRFDRVGNWSSRHCFS